MARFIMTFESGFRRVERRFTIFAGCVVAMITAVVVVDVTARYLFLRSLAGLTEFVQLLLPWVAFITFAYGLTTGTHVRVSLLLDRLPSRIHLGADTLDYLLGIFFTGVLIYFGSLHFWYSASINEAMMARVYLPLWVGKFALPLGMSVFLVRFLCNTSLTLVQLTGRIEQPEEVIEKVKQQI